MNKFFWKWLKTGLYNGSITLIFIPIVLIWFSFAIIYAIIFPIFFNVYSYFVLLWWGPRLDIDNYFYDVAYLFDYLKKFYK